MSKSKIVAIDAGTLFTPGKRWSPGRLLIEGASVAEAGPAESIRIPANSERIDASALLVTPGFIDPHIHGCGGVDVMSGTYESLNAVSRIVARHGTTSFLPTTVSSPPEMLTAVVGRLGGLMSKSFDGATPLGIHLEGPFISAAKRGTHKSANVLAPDLELFEEWLRASGNSIRLLTVAPELDGIEALLLMARHYGVVAAMGHSSASFAEASAAANRGVCYAVHTFNAMRAFSHRDPGIVGEVLADDRIFAEIIADGIHVDRAVVRVFARTKGRERVLLATDAISATDMPDGCYGLGVDTVEMLNGVCRDNEGRLAGSTLTQEIALRNFVEWTGWAMEEALLGVTLNPARALKLEKKGVLEPGADADIAILDEQFRVIQTIVAGHSVFDRSNFAANDTNDANLIARRSPVWANSNMDKLRIKGGTRLEGRVRISGAKNSALPAMAASLLTSQEVVLENLPLVNDIFTTRRLLRELGAVVEFESDHVARLHAQSILSHEAPYDLVKTMRASVLVLGPLLARTGRARVSLPGGCAIGARPIDLHISGFEKLGATVHTEHGYIEAAAERLHGAEIVFDKITVTGTENLMMAAALAAGRTVLRNAACEPEVVDLAEMLADMGGRIEGAGTPVITIEGVGELKGTTHRIIPDRVEAGTFLVAGAITNGELEIADSNPDHMASVIERLRAAGANIETAGTRLMVHPSGDLEAADVVTREYPGFATDMQAQYMALMTQAAGTSVITENIFENRFMHASELRRMGADIRIDGARAVVTGKTPLSGATVIASDLRASASLVLAALVADGLTIVDRVYHLDRGYERIEEKLRSVGAQIERLK